MPRWMSQKTIENLADRFTNKRMCANWRYGVMTSCRKPNINALANSRDWPKQAQPNFYLSHVEQSSSGRGNVLSVNVEQIWANFRPRRMKKLRSISSSVNHQFSRFVMSWRSITLKNTQRAGNAFLFQTDRKRTYSIIPNIIVDANGSVH